MKDIFNVWKDTKTSYSGHIVFVRDRANKKYSRIYFTFGGDTKIVSAIANHPIQNDKELKVKHLGCPRSRFELVCDQLIKSGYQIVIVER